MIGLVAFGCQWLAWRVRLPAILFLLGAGILLGPLTSTISPDAMFGDLLFPLISLSVAIILFEGSLTLDLNEIRSQRAVVQRLILLGGAVTWAVVAIAAHFLLQIEWELSVLFGALTVVTGPTVIVPLLRTVRPNRNIGNILRWEGILIDPIGALLVVVVYEFIVSQSQAAGLSHGFLAFLEILGVGTALGLLGGWSLGFVLQRGWVPEYLKNLATLSVVFAVFSLSDHLAHESGLLAVTLMGMWLANQKRLRIEEILNFKENLSVVLISGLFILLAARLTLDDIIALGWAPLALLAVMQFIARPAAVWLSSIGSSLNWREKALLSWIAPRGIVAAAVSALFAIRLEEAGYETAQILVPLTFSVIIGTVVLQSATSRGLARILQVAEPAPSGFLVVGANPVARAIAKALQEQHFRVLLTDSHWEHIRDARMDGLETFFGNPVSSYADHHLDLMGIGKLLALSPQAGNNVAAGMRFRSEFGDDNIYTLLSPADTETAEKHQLGSGHRGHVLVGQHMSYNKFASLLAQGWEIRDTKLTEAFGFEDFLKAHEHNAVPLFAISPKGRHQAFTEETEVTPEAGWKLLSLTAPRPDEVVPPRRKDIHTKLPPDAPE
ncbi:sodium:proton antiporter [Halopseudomonas nanhaiensis]|uniref:cation:proton antiporter n=1 Tax=Halopseudomonas nanhaiensis TaxID=2830842 RepID=UPI001CC14334|nr:sodium:proton antiporter [Halopseudomonas nanhaiensis]UAW99952.1 sodium:proton antiporter [Halopseudomonas nanhaiensis]